MWQKKVNWNVLNHLQFTNVSKNKVNMLTANYEYSCNNTDDLPLPVQMQLSGKLKTFSWYFIALFDSALNFEHFEKKISLIAQVLLKLFTPKDVFI